MIDVTAPHRPILEWNRPIFYPRVATNLVIGTADRKRVGLNDEAKVGHLCRAIIPALLPFLAEAVLAMWQHEQSRNASLQASSQDLALRRSA
jgi:hypothetical protein